MCQERPFGNHVVTLAFRRRPSFEVTSMYVRTKHQDEPQRIRGHGVRRGRLSRGGARCSAQPEGSDRHVHALGKHNDPAVIEKQKNIRSVYPPSVDVQLVTGCRGTHPCSTDSPLRQKCCSGRKELVRRQRQVADTLSGSIERSIGDGGSDSGNADFADAARAHG
jgi:hypothetical protein